MEDDIDIYEDLPGFGPGGSEMLPQKGEENVSGEQLQLKKQISQLTEKLETFRKLNENLESNLFSLLKTAKAEIARKDNMIDDLRKQLDDFAFKRGAYRMAGNNVVRKVTSREAAKNASRERESPSGYFCSDEGNLDAPKADPPIERDRTKDRQSKSTLIPNTVYGKRLLERLADEQKLERKEELSSKFGRGNGTGTATGTATGTDAGSGSGSASGSGSTENAEGYVVESDKENGSLGDTNLVDANEKAKVVTKDAEFHGKTETICKPERKATVSTASIASTASPASIVATGKRANEDSARYGPAKRLKPSHESYLCDATTTLKEAECKEAGVLSRHSDLRSSVRCKERRHSLKMSDSGYACTSSAEWKRAEYLLEDANKSRGIRDSDKRCSRRRDRSVENSTLPLDKRRANSRCSELSDRDHYRSSRGEHERGRTKAREHRRSDDHRSRLKPLAHEKQSREEKHGKNQYSKQSDYQENFEKGYNFRSSATSNNKPRLCKKDWSSVRDAKKDASSCDQQPRKLRPRSADKPAKRPNNSLGSLKSDPIKSIERVKRSETWRRGGQKEKEKEKEREREKGKEKEEEKELEIYKELEKYAKEELQDTSIELEEGEISNTSSDSGGKNAVGEKAAEGATDRALARNVNCDRRSQAMSEDAFCDIGASGFTCPDQRPSENPSNNESAENLENIEKFIRDYKSTYDNDKTDEKAATTSDTICASLPYDVPSNPIESTAKQETVDISNDASNEQRNLQDQGQVEGNSEERGTPVSGSNEIVSEATTKRVTTDVSNDASNEQRDVSLRVEVEKHCEEDRTPVPSGKEIVSPKLSTANGKSPFVARVSESISIKRKHGCKSDETQIGQPLKPANDIATSHESSDGPPVERAEPPSQPNITLDRSWMAESVAKPQLATEDFPGRCTHYSNSKSSFQQRSRKNSKRINANSTVAIDCIDYSDRSQGKTNVSNGDERAATDRSRSRSRSTSTSTSTSIGMEAAREKERDKGVRLGKEGRPRPRPRPRQQQSSDRNAEPTSTNVHGKIVMVVRRRKPVCLADSNADTTVVISDKQAIDDSEDSSSTTSPTNRNSVVKFARSNGRHATDAS